MDYHTIRSERRGAAVLITLDRPHALNAITEELSMELEAALDAAEADPAVSAVILTGAGERAFSAGADLKELSAGRRPLTPRGGFAGFVQRVFPKPVIAAVNGLAYGGGTEIALACDLIVASETAAFALPEVKRGLAAGSAGGLLRLPRQIPLRIAMELALTGEPLPAREAERWGLVNRVVEPARLLEVALELAEAVARNAPLAVQASKAIIYRALDAPLSGGATAWDAAFALARRVSESEDAREGPRAFAEKRAPVWKGR